MRLRPWFWFTVSVLCFVGAAYFWRLGDRWAAQKAPPSSAGPAADPAPTPSAAAPPGPQAQVAPQPIRLLSQAANLNSAPGPSTASSLAAARTNRLAYRVSNTAANIGDLSRSSHAVLLENALLDTAVPPAQIPAHLRATSDPGSYIVQAPGPLDDIFRAKLKAAGAAIVAYIPNNAYLVRGSAAVVAGLATEAQAILPYEPYYKLKGSLLQLATDQAQLPPAVELNVLLFPDALQTARADLAALGAQIVSEDSSPFGPVLKIVPAAASLPQLAGLSSVQEIETVHQRRQANDLSRSFTHVAADTVVPTNYLGLTGTNVLVNINDTGVDTNHTDLMGRVFADSFLSAVDTNGHGTHVAGIIASSGSTIVSNVSSSAGPYGGTNGQFRGMAPSSQLYSLLADPLFGPNLSDSYLQQTAASASVTNPAGAVSKVFISNNSWNYEDTPQLKPEVATYDLAAASYDAAVRDALPLVSGSQPLLFVFAAGDNGLGEENGSGGLPDTILSPATAKNVITVGAIESPRYITNQATVNGITNSEVFFPSTDSSNNIASFSSRGNVGIGIEGDFGRFKPDLVAPGTFIVSTRSRQWDERDYYATHYQQFHSVIFTPDLFLPPNALFEFPFDVPTNTVAVKVRLVHRQFPSPVAPVNPSAFPDLPLFISKTGQPLPSYDTPPGPGTNELTVLNPTPTGTNWLYTLLNTSTQTVVVQIVLDLQSVDPNDQSSMTLSNLNEDISPGAGADNRYRYESGTSMAAAEVSGALALMQQFLQEHNRTNATGGPQGHSPALMKAMLLNGATTLANGYDLEVKNQVNFQGWGSLNLPASLHGGLATETLATNSMWLVDQDPTNALVTGESHYYKIAVSDDARQSNLKITLVWSDPPGNPIASLKLVNDLDLVITNLDSVGTGFDEVYFGNDIGPGNYNFPWDTNSAPNIDVVNNVETIIIPGPLSTNYSLTVSGHRVNVNAVPDHPDNVAQDYALVVSCGDGTITNAITFARTGGQKLNTPNLTTLTNTYVGSSNYFGQTLVNQRVGASSPLIGTNQFILPSYSDAHITLGVTNQWHFYVIENTSTFTNARFVVSNPRNLSIPREGVNVLIDTNATRLQADTDLYVSKDPNLLLLDPLSVSNALKMIGREGDATIVISNATRSFYYIAVKSEDQMAAEYTLQVLFSLFPFSANNDNGSLMYWLEDTAIPDGSPARPGITNMMVGPADPTMLVRRVIVSNLLSHQLVGDLVGTLTYPDGTFCVLNNHELFPDTPVIRQWFVFDDSSEGNIPGSRPTDGPGSLSDFAGRRLGQLFTFYMEDNALNHLGTNNQFYLFAEKQQPLTNGITVDILPGACRDDYIEVPPNAIALTVSATVLAGDGSQLYLQVCEAAVGGLCTSNVTVNAGISLTIDQFSVPPIKPGTYRVRLCNKGTASVRVFLIATIEFANNPFRTVTYTTNPIVPIKDNAVTYTAIQITNHFSLASLDVGLLLSDPRVSDLAITLISPTGKRILLFEDRGAYSTNLGTLSLTTNQFGVPGYGYTNMAGCYTNNFDDVLTGPYTPGAIFDGWNVVSNSVVVYPELPAPWLSNNVLVLGYGVVSNAIPNTNSSLYSLSFNVTHAPYLVGMVGWWPLDGDATDIYGGLNGLLSGDVSFTQTGKVSQAFIGDGIGTRVLVPRSPQVDVGARRGFSIEGWINPASISAGTNTIVGATVLADGFENAPEQPGPFSAGTYVSGWLIESGQIDIDYPGFGFDGLPDSGRHSLELNGDTTGSISTNLLTVPGKTYQLSFAYTKNPSPEVPPGFTALANVLLTGQPTVLISCNTTNDYANLNWSHTSWVFKATSPLTKLQFTSLNPGNAGLYLDTVGVSEVTIPSIANPIAEWNDTTNARPQGVQLWLSGLPGTNSSGAIFADLWDTNFQEHIIATVPNAYTNGGWQHVALTYDAASLIARLYTNGHLASFKVMAITNSFRPRTSGDLYLGYHPASGPGFFAFQGGLDEISLFDRALTDCEVAAIFNSGAGGKYGTNVLTCPVTNLVQLTTPYGSQAYTFVNGLYWTNGPQWETNTVVFSNTLVAAFTNGPATNYAALTITPLDPNVALDNFILSALTTNFVDGMMHFTEDPNLAVLPIKFGAWPYSVSNFPPALIFSNDFSSVTQFVGSPTYRPGDTIPGGTNNPAFGPRDWTVVDGSVTVLSNTLVAMPNTTNCLALSTGAVQCLLPTAAGHRYQLTYSVRGPGAVSWWNGEMEPFSHRAWDLIGGNHAAFFYDATNTPDTFVGPHALNLPGYPNPTNQLVSKLEIGDPPNLRLTNAFTIEGWVRPLVRTNYNVEAIEQILFRGETHDFNDPFYRGPSPYFLGLERVTDTGMDIVFHIEDDQQQDGGVILETARQPVTIGQWQHIAAVFDTYVAWTNDATYFTNELRLYLNGRQLTVANNDVFMEDPLLATGFGTAYTGRFPFRDLDPAFSPGVSIGARSRHDLAEPFRGDLDELSVYGRALTGPEIAAISAAGRAGKADFRASAGQSLAKLSVSIDGAQRDIVNPDNSKWQTRTIEFTALGTNAAVVLQSLLPGTILGGITLTELPPELNYLPEVSLDALDGTDAFGTWQLEIWDTRTGPGIQLTNLATLLSWQLTFKLLPVPVPPIVTLQHGIPYTNSLVPGGVQNFIVDVPQWATMATNILISSVQYQTTNQLPVGVLYDTNGFPVDITNGLFWPPVTAGITNLTTNGSPFIVIGQPYYLSVTNTNTVSVTFAISVWFDITTLTNCQAQSNFVTQAGIPRYFQFDVATNYDAPPDSQPQEAYLWLSGIQSNFTGLGSNVTVVLSQHLPLPDLDHYDYLAHMPSTNNTIVMVLTNTTPFAIQTNRWYVGVFSGAATNVPFLIQACYTTNTFPTIIPLTNGLPFVASITNRYVAPPGPPQWFFFQFQITNSTLGVLFELYNLSGDADLVLQRDLPPAMPPYFAGSFRTGLTPEQIVLRPGLQIPDLVGNWYLGVFNNTPTNVAYTIRAVRANGGLLQSAQPLQARLSPMAPPHGLLLQWNSVIGEYYVIEFTDTLSPPNWQLVFNGRIQATTPLTTFEVPIPPNGMGFYRVRQLSAFALPTPPLRIQLWTNNQVRISWSTNFPGQILQSAPNFNGPWSNLAPPRPINVEGPLFVVYDLIGVAPRYYRLIP